MREIYLCKIQVMANAEGSAHGYHSSPKHLSLNSQYLTLYLIVASGNMAIIVTFQQGMARLSCVLLLSVLYTPTSCESYFKFVLAYARCWYPRYCY